MTYIFKPNHDLPQPNHVVLLPKPNQTTTEILEHFLNTLKYYNLKCHNYLVTYRT